MTEFTIFPTVGSIAQKSVLRATLDMTVRAVSDLMDQHSVSSVLIEKNNEYYVFSVEDLLEHLQDGKNNLATLAEANVNKISCVLDSEHVLTAMEVLELSGERYLGIVDVNNFLTGILTYTDILSAVDPTLLVQKKTIGELVSRTEPVTFTPDWILEDVLSHLRKMEDSIIVVESGEPVGIVTTKDIFKIISTGQSTDKPLTHYMVSPVITTCVSSTIHEALSQLKHFRIKRSIVVNKANQLVGVVTQSELVGFAYGTWIELVKHHAGELKELVGILEAKAIGFEKLSVTDPLTGLGNRLFLDKRLIIETERIHRYRSSSFSLLLIDIDCFGSINEQFGRLDGDEILKAVGIKLTELVRTTEDVSRWGGSKFAILLPYTSINSASEFASRVCTTIESFSFINGIRITVSVGVGQYTLTENEATFFDRVYKTLICAKKQGRNQVAIDFDNCAFLDTC